MPLRALLDGQDFFAWDLAESNRKKEYICPICKTKFQAVLPKRGIINYFRHIHGKAHQEKETPEHLYGKKVLMDLASKLGLKALLEPPIGNHVPDVLLEGEQPIAIEFQCSPCNSTQILDRAKTYSENGKAAFWILGKNFYKDFNKKTRKKIEREIEKLHPTVYFVDNKFTVVRDNPKYYDYYHQYNREDFRLVEDFDIEWHLLSFVKNRLTAENPSLLFRWMEPKKPKQAEQSKNDKIAEQQEQPKQYTIIKPSGWTKIKRNVTMDDAGRQPILWQKVPTTEICELCGKNVGEYAIKIFEHQPPLKRCEVCFIDLKKKLSNVSWKRKQ